MGDELAVVASHWLSIETLGSDFTLELDGGTTLSLQFRFELMTIIRVRL